MTLARGVPTNRGEAVLTLGLATLLALGASGCGRYGPPVRPPASERPTAPSAAATPSATPDESEDESAVRQP